VNGVKKEEQSSFPHTVLIGLSWEASDLPYDIFSQLEEIQDSEYLYSAITNHVQEKADESKANESGYCNKCGTYSSARSMKSHMQNKHPEVPRREWKTLEYMGSAVSGDDRYVGDDIAQRYYGNTQELQKAMGWGRKDDGWSSPSDWGSVEAIASEDATGSKVNFKNMISQTPYDEQQGRLRNARDEESPLDNIYSNDRVADRIASGTHFTHAQDMTDDWSGNPIHETWKSVEAIANEAESCKQCGRLGWSSDPKNCDDCSDPAGDGYEPDLDGELGTGLY